MSLLLLIAISLGMGLVGLAAFMWALRDGQFDDPEGNAWRVVAPQEPPGTKGGPEPEWIPTPPTASAESHERGLNPARSTVLAANGYRPGAP